MLADIPIIFVSWQPIVFVRWLTNSIYYLGIKTKYKTGSSLKDIVHWFTQKHRLHLINWLRNQSILNILDIDPGSKIPTKIAKWFIQIILYFWESGIWIKIIWITSFAFLNSSLTSSRVTSNSSSLSSS